MKDEKNNRWSGLYRKDTKTPNKGSKRHSDAYRFHSVTQPYSHPPPIQPSSPLPLSTSVFLQQLYPLHQPLDTHLQALKFFSGQVPSPVITISQVFLGPGEVIFRVVSKTISLRARSYMHDCVFACARA